MTRERAPKGPSPKPAAKRKLAGDSTPPPPDPEYDAAAGDLEGYTSDPLTADAWAAICMAEQRDIALSEVAP